MGLSMPWVLEQNVITWFVDNNYGSSSSNWNSGKGVNMAIHLLQHPIHFFWNDHYNAHTHTECMQTISVSSAQNSWALLRLTGVLGGTHKCVAEWGVKELMIKNSTQGPPFPLGSVSVTPQRLPHMVITGTVRQDSGGNHGVPWK